MEIQQFEKGPYRVISHDHPAGSKQPRPRSIMVGEEGECLCECDGSQKAVVRCRAEVYQQPLELSAEVEQQVAHGRRSREIADLHDTEVSSQLSVRKMCAELGLIGLNGPIFTARLKQIDLALSILESISGAPPEPIGSEQWHENKKALILAVETYNLVPERFSKIKPVRDFTPRDSTSTLLSIRIIAVVSKCNGPQDLVANERLVYALRQVLKATHRYYSYIAANHLGLTDNVI